jgi:hypothetical protein
MGRRWNRALVTGASSGIGGACCRILAAEGTDLVVVARDVDRLRALAGELQPAVTVEVLGADLADPEQLAAVEARLRTDEEAVDLLVNNAGFGKTGDFVDLDIEVETNVVTVNVTAVLRLAHAAGGRMAATGSGTILNVSSVAAYLPGPGSATYAATKAFVTAFSIGLGEELGPTGVTVTTLAPGFTRTEFQERAGMDPAEVPGLVWQSADHVARVGLEGAQAGKLVVIPGAHNKLAAGIGRLLPGWLLTKVTEVGRKATSRP